MASENPWSASESFDGVVADVRDPAIALVGEIPHVVWSRGRILHHAVHVGGRWSSPGKVHPGEQPSCLTTADGRLHCVFAHAFMGNYEIFYISYDGDKWSVPQPVARTSGLSSRPALASAPDGTLWAAWSDTTPGYPTVYVARRERAGWVSGPVPGARGTRPVLALNRDSSAYLAWQDRRPTSKRYEVFCAVRQKDVWSTSLVVSDTPTQHSVLPHLAASVLGICHMIWLEDRGGVYAVMHSAHFANGWSVPSVVSTPGRDCRNPRAACNRQGNLQVVWSDGGDVKHRYRSPAAEVTWWPEERVRGSADGIPDLSWGLSPSGVGHLVSTQFSPSATALPAYTFRRPLYRQSSFVPSLAN
jgi:hypothetical protein